MDWFAARLLDWFDRHGRTDLPWQQDIDPYRVWVSEIMLQQTQVATVIPYYQRFMARFPTVADLAAAGIDEVLHHWTGLGYYARGRNLHAAARRVVAELGGQFPASVDALNALPGIGRSTAGAVAAIGFGIRAPILDGNVKRVLTRFHAVDGYPGETAVAARLWALADEHTPAGRVADYTQAIMDLGATVCVRSRPHCGDCPLAQRCAARAAGSVDRYPGRKPKQDKPVRQVRMFVLHDQHGACLLEQRPANGVWGGLWTPPERPAATSPAQFLSTVGLPEAAPLRTVEARAFRHTFTHFHLDIQPVYIEVPAPPPMIRERDDLRWYRHGDNEPLGLSAPAVKLLRALTEFTLE
ncbi:MAG TPA: A/G-specific adenine glycosylase [Pseudomonadales bacterium]